MAGRPRTPEGDKVRDTILTMLRLAELNYSPTPSFVEIGEALGRAHSTIHAYLRPMQRDGLVTWKKRQPRTLTLTEAGRAQADELLATPAR